MADRALVYLHSPRQRVLSCGLYLHDDGWQVRELLSHALKFMRHGDVPYDFAKLVAVVGYKLSNRETCRTFCVYPPPSGDYDRQLERVQAPAHSHGDAGVFLVNIDKWQVLTCNGYGFSRHAGGASAQLDRTSVGVMLPPEARASSSLDDLLDDIASTERTGEKP